MKSEKIDHLESETIEEISRLTKKLQVMEDALKKIASEDCEACKWEGMACKNTEYAVKVLAVPEKSLGGLSVGACDICNQFHLSSAEALRCEFLAWDRASDYCLKSEVGLCDDNNL